MTQFSQEHIQKYLDQELSADQRKAFEKALQNDTSLKSDYEQLQIAHKALERNKLEKAPDQFSARVLAAISGSSRKYYYSHGLGGNTGFLLISGIITALIALLSVINSGYLDLQGLTQFLPNVDASIENNFLRGLVKQQTLTKAMMVILGILAITILDRFILNPMFRKRVRQLDLN